MTQKTPFDHLLRVNYDNFILSREAMNVSKSTIITYRSVLGKFIAWLESEGITAPNQITSFHIRSFMSQVKGKPWTLNGYGRAIRTLMIFWFEERTIPEKIKVEVPRVRRQKLPFLTGPQIKQLLDLCTARERALVTFMVDTGLRRMEVSNLNVSDVNFDNGAVRVLHGKGDKYRLAVIGPTAKRTLLTAMKHNKDKSEDAPLFQTREGNRLTGNAIQLLFRRLSERTGMKVTPHMLRRSFATLTLKSGIDLVSLQILMGHESIETTRGYIQLLDDDLIKAHSVHSPMDNLRRL